MKAKRTTSSSPKREDIDIRYIGRTVSDAALPDYKGVARAYVETLGPQRLIGVVKTSNGSYHEIPASNVTELRSDVKAFCETNRWSLQRIELDSECEKINLSPTERIRCIRSKLQAKRGCTFEGVGA